MAGSSFTGASYNLLRPTLPYQGDNQFYNLMKQNWKVAPQDFTGDFKNIYNSLLANMKGLNTGAGLGSYDVGKSGLGLYSSGLLDNLATNAQRDINDPNLGFDAKLGQQMYGNMQDRLTGETQAAMQSLNDQNAGWSRGAGIVNAQRAALLRDSERTAAENARNVYGMEADWARQAKQQAIANALGLEEMRGGFFENSKGRELQNAQLGSSAFEGAKGRELQNAGLQKDLFALYPGLLGSLLDAYKMAGDNSTTAQQQSFQNLGLLDQMANSKGQQAYDNSIQWGKDMQKYDYLKEATNPSRDSNWFKQYNFPISRGMGRY